MPRTLAVSSRGSTSFRCTECGWATAKWVGRCGECQGWGTVDEVAPPGASRRATPTGPLSAPAVRIGEVDLRQAAAVPTQVGELDRVLGGGLVPGAVVLVAGEPGIGKSTLLLDVAARAARAGRRALYISGEESAAQVRLRAERLGAVADDLWLAAECDLGSVLGQVAQVRPQLLVLDSVQTVGSAGVDGAAGGVSQVREVAAALTRVAKEDAVTVVLVGHVTKEGSVAGPRTLEHLVDVVLSFEGDRHARLRLVRGVKNRFGPADEVGCFDLQEQGLVEVPDPSGLFLSRGGGVSGAVSGTAVTVAMEGRRPLVAEVQALVGASADHGAARRSVTGLEAGRAAMVLAVLSRHLAPVAGTAAARRLATSEVFAATVGGVRLAEPAADLAVALAVTSSLVGRPVPADLVVLGEVGLAGEVRPVPAVLPRLAEAARLGFRRALVPASVPLPERPPLDVWAVATVQQALLRLDAEPAVERRPSRLRVAD